MAYEAARILLNLGADVRVFDPAGLPMKDGSSEKHAKVLELRALSDWSDGHFWCSPEQHGTITAVFKNQSAWALPSWPGSRETPAHARRVLTLTTVLLACAVDWIPLSVGSVRPSQGRTLAVCQVNGALPLRWQRTLCSCRPI